MLLHPRIKHLPRQKESPCLNLHGVTADKGLGGRRTTSDLTDPLPPAERPADHNHPTCLNLCQLRLRQMDRPSRFARLASACLLSALDGVNNPRLDALSNLCPRAIHELPPSTVTSENGQSLLAGGKTRRTSNRQRQAGTERICGVKRLVTLVNLRLSNLPVAEAGGF
jgi:hypothetical protein